MVEIEFNYNQRIISIHSELDEPFKTAINKYKQKTSFKEVQLFFMHNEKIIDNIKNKVKDIMSEFNMKDKKNECFSRDYYKRK